MTSELFIPIKFRTTIQLVPIEINKNFEKTILNKLKKNLEGVCSKHGYIREDSIKIIKRSVGMFKKQNFNGNIIFDIECIAEICNPAQGSIIKCTVKAKNSLGILAEGFYSNKPILEIIIPKISAGIQSEINIDKINIGDEIKIEVCGKKFQLFDKHISIIGKAIKDKDINIKTVIENLDDIDDNKQVDDDLPIIDIDDEKLTIDQDDEDDELSSKKKDEEDEEEEELDDLEDLDLEEELDDDLGDFSGGEEFSFD